MTVLISSDYRGGVLTFTWYYIYGILRNFIFRFFSNLDKNTWKLFLIALLGGKKKVRNQRTCSKKNLRLHILRSQSRILQASIFNNKQRQHRNKRGKIIRLINNSFIYFFSTDFLIEKSRSQLIFFVKESF